MSINDVAPIVSTLKDCFYRPVADRVSLLRSLRRKADDLKTDVRRLEGVKKDIDAAVDRNCGGDPNGRVNAWIDNVKEFLVSYGDFERKYAERPSSCNCLCRCGALENYNLAKKANELLERASRLKTEGDEFLPNENPLGQGAPARVENIPIYGPVVGQEEEFQKVLKLIEEDDESIGVVGIWGMGGVGKTTLLQRINNHFDNDNSFDHVIFTAAPRNSLETGNSSSGSSSIFEMQQDIGNRLGLFQSKTGNERLGMSHLETGDERNHQARILKSLLSNIGNEMLGMSHLETRDEGNNAKLIFNYLRSKSFLLLLDDLWEVTDLKRLGIPPLNSSSMEGRELLQQQQKKKKKIVVTTRNRGVCYDMGSTNRGIVELGLLSPEMSWQLFCKHVKNDPLFEKNSDVASLARDVAKECDRLPLALVTVGKAMSRYEEACAWSNAKQELQTSKFQPMKKDVLPQLKFSFDRLEPDSMRHILLFFAWLSPTRRREKNNAANILAATDAYSGSESSDWKSAQDKALTWISDVVNSGLLMYDDEEKNYVKLHDCVYDMLRSLTETESYTDYGTIMLRWSPSHSREQKLQRYLSEFIRRWEWAQNISMEECDLVEIPSDVEMPNCNVLRCLYWPHGKLLRFPEHFFDRMTCLRALILHNSDIEELPRSFGYQQPVNLKYLDLTNSRIRKLPEGMGNLRQLVYLNLRLTQQLEDIPCSCLSGLESLEEFRISGSAFRWTWDGNDGNDSNGRRRQATLQNLGELRTLRTMSISLQVDAAIMSGLMLCSDGLLHSIDSFHMDFHVFKGCIDFDELLKIFARLKNVECMLLQNIPPTMEFRPLTEDDFQICDDYFPKLTWLAILNWFDICDLAWSKRIPGLGEFYVRHCPNLSVLFSESSKEDFSHLKILEIEDCPKLNSIARCTSLLFPSLETVVIKGCPQLKILPFNEESATKIKKIEASEEWWNVLEWENDNARSKFLSHFSASETESDTEYGNIMLRWSPPDSRDQQLQYYPLSKFFARWECAQIISMDGCDLTEIPSDVEMPNCSTLRWLYWPDGKLLRFPEHFFDRMTCLRRLDLYNSDIEELPPSFGYQLVNLKHLDLSKSRIRKLPEAMGNLRQLVYLDLDFTEQLEDIPCSCFSGLESLEEFRISGSAFQWTSDGNDGRRSQATLQTLKELGTLRKIHISLQIDAAILSGLMLCSDGLLHSIQWLEMDFHVFKGCMDFDELLKIFARLENVEYMFLQNIPPPMEFRLITEDDFQACNGSSSSPPHLFPMLKNLRIMNWLDICDLAWSKRIPHLEEVCVWYCPNLSVLFSESSKEGFPHLKILEIEDCPKLNSIVRCTSLLLPSLETVVIKGCPHLKSLPFNEQSAKGIKRIEASEEWWNALEWENDNVKSKFRSYFNATDRESDKENGNIMLWWSPPDSREQQLQYYPLSKFFARWECVEIISMKGCDLTEIPSDIEMPNCSALRRLDWPDGKLLRFPENFFDRMTCLRKLDLRNSDIEELPPSFGYQLVNLEHLHLSKSRIRKLPEDMGNLRQLVLLDLSYTKQLEDIPCSCFSGLEESLEEFYIDGSSFRWTWDDNDGRDNDDGNDSNGRRRQATLQNLGELRTLRRTDISLQVNAAIMSGLMLCSDRLLHSIQWLEMDFAVFKGCMDSDGSLHHLLPNLKVLKIENWLDICDLTCCKRIARLKVLFVSNCENLSELFSESCKEDFPHLKSLVISNCPKLNRIARYCTSLLVLPSLEYVDIDSCPELKSLPFNEQSAKKIKRIYGSQEWWNLLKWENDNVKSKFLPHFIAKVDGEEVDWDEIWNI